MGETSRGMIFCLPRNKERREMMVSAKIDEAYEMTECIVDSF